MPSPAHRPTLRHGLFLFAAMAMSLAGAAAPAQSSGAASASGLPTPRFVSLKSSRVNVRVGPGQSYQISWIFTRPGLPVEVIQEFDTWRRVRDSDGSVGWVFHSLLSGKRTGVVTPWGQPEPSVIRRAPRADARIAAYLEAGVLGEVSECRDNWCHFSGEGYAGWIPQDSLWGVYPGETVD